MFRARLGLKVIELQKRLAAMEEMEGTAKHLQDQVHTIQSGVSKALSAYRSLPRPSDHLRAVRLTLFDLLPTQDRFGLGDHRRALEQVGAMMH